MHGPMNDSAVEHIKAAPFLVSEFCLRVYDDRHMNNAVLKWFPEGGQHCQGTWTLPKGPNKLGQVYFAPA